MPILNKGTTFATDDQVTSAKLNNIVDTADFTNTSGAAVDSAGTTGTCVSDGGLEVTDPGGQLQIKSNGVTTSKILNSNVTKAKIENVANMKVLGNTSGSAVAPQEVNINDTDDMSDASATTLATSESIKAYVDSLGTSIYRTVDARNGTSTSIQNFENWEELYNPAQLGSWNSYDRYVFASTGTYLIESTISIQDNDTESNDAYYPRFRVFNDLTSSFNDAAHTTNNNGVGSGSDLEVASYVWYKYPSTTGTHTEPNVHSLSFVLKVENTSAAQPYIQIEKLSGALNSQWEAAAILKITKLSSSLI